MGKSGHENVAESISGVGVSRLQHPSQHAWLPPQYCIIPVLQVDRFTRAGSLAELSLLSGQCPAAMAVCLVHADPSVVRRQL